MKRKFVTNHFNGYSVRSHYFIPNASGRGCSFETDDPDVIRLIESCTDFLNGKIVPAETPEEIAAMQKKDERQARTVPRYSLDEPEQPEHPPPLEAEVIPPAEPEPVPGEKKNEEDAPQEESEEEEAPPIAHQGARGTQTGRGQRRGYVIDPKEK